MAQVCSANRSQGHSITEVAVGVDTSSAFAHDTSDSVARQIVNALVADLDLATK
jgi:hypothetical protein